MAPVIEFPEELSKYIAFEVLFDHKTQYAMKFENNYGISILWWDAGYNVGSHGFEEGLWEIAAVKWVGDSFTIVQSYGEEGVVGNLTEEGVLNAIREIQGAEVDSLD